jgi:hypothetical protein
MNTIVEAGVTIALAVIGLAIISVIISRNANTTEVIRAGASGLANNLAVAASPVTGVNVSPSLGYPSPSNQGFGFGS